MTMRRVLFFVLALGLFAGSLSAAVYKLEGMVGGKYAIVIELEKHDDGMCSGRYAYKSTLAKSGNIDCSWLQINPNFDNPYSVWDVRDCKLNPVETWYNVKFNDGKRLTCSMKNTKGKVYNIVANVVSSSIQSPSWIDYFRSHIGDSPSTIGLFSDPSVQGRLEDLMGANTFEYFTYIYQVQGGIEYTKGMYWGSAFMAHQCCDPATVWAYDADYDLFYVWIRKDGKDYWWSESGNVPYKFQELVRATI